MLAISFSAMALCLLASRYRIWIYAALSGMVFALTLWSMIEFLVTILPVDWQGLSAFLAIVWLYFVLFGVVNSYQKWQQHKHKQSSL